MQELRLNSFNDVKQPSLLGNSSMPMDNRSFSNEERYQNDFGRILIFLQNRNNSFNDDRFPKDSGEIYSLLTTKPSETQAVAAKVEVTDR